MLHIESGRHLYGGARQAGYLAAELSRHGVESRLVCEPGHALADQLGKNAIACASGGDLDLAYYGRLRAIIRAEQPDIVHVHSRRGADIFGGRAARAEHVPAVLTRRIESREPAAWLRFKCRPYAAVVAISSAVAEELAQAGIHAGRLQRIPSAVDTARFRPHPGARAKLLARYALPDDAVLAGCAAQLIARKGVGGLLPLAGALVRAEPRFRLLLFGEGPRRAGLERQIQALGLDSIVTVCGYSADWPVLVPGLDVLLHPARREGLGSVLLEAKAAGVPVLAAAVGGVVDAIEDGVDGRLLPAADAAAWETAVLALIRDEAAREALAAAGRRSVEQRFTIAAMTEAYLALYHRLHG